MSVVVVVGSQSQLFQVVLALSASSCFPSLLHGRQKQSDEDRNDCDDDKEFDQGKSTLRVSMFFHCEGLFEKVLAEGPVRPNQLTARSDARE